MRMVTVLRVQGLRVVIFVTDHLPAQVHVLGDGEAKINLLDADGAGLGRWHEPRLCPWRPACGDRAAGVLDQALGGDPWPS